jgi:hypothetical protein
LGHTGSSSILATVTSRLTFTSNGHVEPDDSVAKFWLDPVRLARSGGFGRAEIRDIGRLVGEHQRELLEAWNDFFGD